MVGRQRERSAVVAAAVGAVIVGVITVLAFVALSQAGQGLRDDGHLINVAGRQRLFSQQVSLATAQVLDAPDATARSTARTELARVVAEMRQGHQGLLSGDDSLQLPAPTDQVRQWYAEAGGAALDTELAAFWADASAVAASDAGIQQAADRIRAAAAGPLLADLDAVVTQFDQGSARRLDDFHRLVLGTGVGVFLVGAVTAGLVGEVLRRDRLRLVSARGEAERSRAELLVLKHFDEGVLETVGAGVLAADAEGRVVVRNAAHRRMTGVPLGDPDPGDVADSVTVHLQDGTVLRAADSPLNKALRGEAVHDLVLGVSDRLGEHRDLLVSAERICGPDGTVLGAVTVATDITTERRVQRQLREAGDFQAAVLTASPDVVYVLDLRTGAHLWTSRALEGMLGYTAAHLAELGDDLYAHLVHPEDVDAIRAGNAEAAALADGGLFAQRYRVLHADGSYRWLSRRLTPFRRSPDGTLVEALGVARDVTEVVEAESALREAALHDALTGLPNRAHLAEKMAAVLPGAPGPVAVLFCDLDGFKAVNDTGGHAAGDALLVASGARLRASVRPGDLVARVGGDEFVVLLVPEEARDIGVDALRVAERITLALQEPVPHRGAEYRVTVSTGVTLVAPGTDPDLALTTADAAMYEAKSLGKNQHRLVTPVA